MVSSKHFLIHFWNHLIETTIKKTGCLGYQVDLVVRSSDVQIMLVYMSGKAYLLHVGFSSDVLIIMSFTPQKTNMTIETTPCSTGKYIFKRLELSIVMLVFLGVRFTATKDDIPLY